MLKSQCDDAAFQRCHCQCIRRIPSYPGAGQLNGNGWQQETGTRDSVKPYQAARSQRFNQYFRRWDVWEHAILNRWFTSPNSRGAGPWKPRFYATLRLRIMETKMKRREFLKTMAFSTSGLLFLT